MRQQKEAPVLVRNKDIEHLVNAAANLSYYGQGKKEDRRWTLLVATDPHGDQQRLQNAIEYLNGMEALDAGICLGDIQKSTFAENDGSWYVDTVKRAGKPFFTVVGNHDGGNSEAAEISGSKEQVFAQFFAPLREQMGLPVLQKTWYSVNLDVYQVTLIVLDNYDVPDDRNEAGDFEVNRCVERIGQEQADWLVYTLKQVPLHYHVLIARHSYPDKGVPIQCTWTTANRNMVGGNQGNATQSLVEEVVDAWMNGTVLEKEYRSGVESPVLAPIKVKADFKERGQGVFIGYIIGHTHWDWQGKSEKYPKQNIYCFASMSGGKTENLDCDLPRLEGTKTEDCITVFSVSHKNRCVYLVRVGSNVTNALTDRTYISFSY